jgi:hypothetical protein
VLTVKYSVPWEEFSRAFAKTLGIDVREPDITTPLPNEPTEDELIRASEEVLKEYEDR